MAHIRVHGHDVQYHLEGPKAAPLIAFVNGLTQFTEAWSAYTTHFVTQGYRVLRFDMLGQGQSDKPALGVPFEAHWQTLEALLDHAESETAHIAGISFGGAVALQFACNRPQRCRSLIPMSCFAEVPAQLFHIGCGLHDALISGGLPSLQRWLMPMNMSDAWLDSNAAEIPAMMRRSYAINDLYAVQNLMESVLEFGPLTDHLSQITCPTMILNGEFDFFTPRKCHELLRQGIATSRLVIVQNAYHAFTLEHPRITMRLMDAFFAGLADGSWQGDRSVWIGCARPEDPEPWQPYRGDHMRAIALPAPDPAEGRGTAAVPPNDTAEAERIRDAS